MAIYCPICTKRIWFWQRRFGAMFNSTWHYKCLENQIDEFNTGGGA